MVAISIILFHLPTSLHQQDMLFDWEIVTEKSINTTILSLSIEKLQNVCENNRKVSLLMGIPMR